MKGPRNIDVLKEVNAKIDAALEEKDNKPLTDEQFFKSDLYNEMVKNVSLAFQILNPRGWTLSPHRDGKHFFLVKTGPFEHKSHALEEDVGASLSKEAIHELLQIASTLDTQVATQSMELNTIGIRFNQAIDNTEEDYWERLNKLETAWVEWTHEMRSMSELLDVIYEVLNL
jgi:hypothetical protein